MSEKHFDNNVATDTESNLEDLVTVDGGVRNDKKFIEKHKFFVLNNDVEGLFGLYKRYHNRDRILVDELARQALEHFEKGVREASAVEKMARQELEAKLQSKSEIEEVRSDVEEMYQKYLGESSRQRSNHTFAEYLEKSYSNFAVDPKKLESMMILAKDLSGKNRNFISRPYQSAASEASHRQRELFESQDLLDRARISYSEFTQDTI